MEKGSIEYFNKKYKKLIDEKIKFKRWKKKWNKYKKY
jgi:hypothetical protein